VTGTPDPFEHGDAAYVLGALSHEDRMAYEEHLRTCARCSAAVAELAVLPGLLGRLPALPTPAGAPEQPPETVLPGLLARMRRSRARRRARTAAVAVAAAAVLVTGTAVVTAQTRSAPEVAGVPVILVAPGDAPVNAELRLEDVAWGTRITMTCRYEGPPPSGPYAAPHTYQLVVVAAADRSTQSVAQWQALPGRDAHVAGSTELSSDEIAVVQLRDGDGTVLLEGRPAR
jgi:anti-sigma factor RsiW